ncbi:PLP-dependent aminotransferase family protein [Salicibibacter kimchii]|uniref:PLP-dependent aminotransferase family protein n=1 Tax=Salicibibacter kimchii TaxID=2099786 RepID=A0A345C1N6_9BACI|nr:PLP-dependent aminotransferase family protein [Salicibibacter kimchii]AXF57117.1 PLP-dependent aminotransferase family protein [Salicibibacter kimchii]
MARTNNNENFPQYLRVMTHIQDKIRDGEWTYGKKLPSQRALAEEFNVNRTTIVHALEELKASGILESKPGSGTYVSNQNWSDISNQVIDWDTISQYSFHAGSPRTIRKINDLETDATMIQLGKGELHSSLFPTKTFRESIANVSESFHLSGYDDGKGDFHLREVLSFRLQEQGIHYSSSSILIVSGALQALQLISMGLLQQGTYVYLEQPSYIYSLQVFRSLGMHLKGIPYVSGELDVRYLENQIRANKKPSMLYLNPTFQNPTTKTMSWKNKQEVLTLANAYQLPIIEDDIYRDIWLDREAEPSLASMDDGDHVLRIGSFSKTVAPSLRIGWIAGPEDVIQKLGDLRMQTDYGSSALPQIAMHDFLVSGKYDEHLSFLRKQVLKRRDFMVQLVSLHLGDWVEWEVPEGGMFLWLTFSSDVNVKKLFTEAIRRGVLINPGYIYSPYNNQNVRLSYVSSSFQKIEAGIIILREIIKAMERSNYRSCFS